MLALETLVKEDWCSRLMIQLIVHGGEETSHD
jgi:hypothetical protein